MSQLKVRTLNFHFDSDIPFQWNYGNPSCGNLFNIITIAGPCFERYFIRAIKQALPLIKSDAVKHDAQLFCNQEGQHAKQHIAHLKMLNERYPGLLDVQRRVQDSYDELYNNNTLEFNLAYMASLEACFTPFALYCIKNIESLFGDSDPRIASFMLWHLVEEFEHRTTALDIYNDVVGSHWYRLKTFSAMARHQVETGNMCSDGFDRFVPASHNTIAHDYMRGLIRGTSGRLALVLGLMDTLLPSHRPDKCATPSWMQRWFSDESSGTVDMALYFPNI
jgi:predicted metal-dependent hydrolase